MDEIIFALGLNACPAFYSHKFKAGGFVVIRLGLYSGFKIFL